MRLVEQFSIGLREPGKPTDRLPGKRPVAIIWNSVDRNWSLADFDPMVRFFVLSIWYWLMTAWVTVPLFAETTLPSVFSDHMVLQRGESTPIWGVAPPGQDIVVQFGDQLVKAKADSQGHWKLELVNLMASAKGRVLKVIGDEPIEFSDVLVGDVWLASGQSNMAMTVGKSEGYEEAVKVSPDPKLRIMVLRPARVSPVKPLTECNGEWIIAGPKTIGSVTAAGYYFAKRLRDELGDLPIGLIQSSWGGTLAEQWTSREALESHPKTKPLWEEFQKRVNEFDPTTVTPPDVAQKLLRDWQVLNKEARRKKERIPPRPLIVSGPLKKRYTPTNQFNTMIHPIIPFGIRGIVWYQGEGNRARAEQYETLLPIMIADWRTRWNRHDAPFYIVQLANNGKPGDELIESEWAELQWAQCKVARSVPGSGLAVINDGTDSSLHPREKKKVGERLALLALAHDYGVKGIESSGPLYRESMIEGNSIRISFDHDKGLRSRDGKPLGSFQIAGLDKNWESAEAKIDGQTVLVSHPDIVSPVAVRYAWRGNPTVANLTNSSGLPASLFKTDDWAGLSFGKILP